MIWKQPRWTTHQSTVPPPRRTHEFRRRCVCRPPATHLDVEEVDVRRPQAVDDAAPADQKQLAGVGGRAQPVVLPLLPQVDVQVVVLQHVDAEQSQGNDLGIIVRECL